MPRNPKSKSNTRRIWFIVEVVEGGRPGSTYYPEDKVRQVFDEMVKELGYEVDDDLAYDPNDGNRNFVAIDYVDIPN